VSVEASSSTGVASDAAAAVVSSHSIGFDSAPLHESQSVYLNCWGGHLPGSTTNTGTYKATLLTGADVDGATRLKGGHLWSTGAATSSA
jgi:hypothetical protein